MCRLTQLNIHLNYETACYLQEVSVMEDEPMTEILRQSVSMHHFFNDATAAGYEVVLRDRQSGEVLALKQANERGIRSRFASTPRGED